MNKGQSRIPRKWEDCKSQVAHWEMIVLHKNGCQPMVRFPQVSRPELRVTRIIYLDKSSAQISRYVINNHEWSIMNLDWLKIMYLIQRLTWIISVHPLLIISINNLKCQHFKNLLTIQYCWRTAEGRVFNLYLLYSKSLWKKKYVFHLSEYKLSLSF